jgi:hypothetical protein
MKYLEKFKTFESLSEINTYIKNVRDILLDLVDDEWIVKVNYTPKRWERPSAGYRIKSDHISVVINRKQNSEYGFSMALFPDNSEFKFSEVSDYIARIIDYFMTDDYRIRICETVGDTYYGKGKWSNWMDSKFPEQDKEILGIQIEIYLQGENLAFID